MNSHQSQSTTWPAGEPKAGRAPVPVWLFVLAFLLLFWGMNYFDQNSGWFKPAIYAPYRNMAELEKFQPATGGANLALGKAKYEAVCALCHGSDGAGKPNQFPPLAGSDWVTGSANRLIRIPLSGLTGPITVKGEQWNLAMPAMGAAMTDEELASVLTYIRSSWGNKAPEITAEQVKSVRAQTGGRTAPWTGAELMNVPEK